MDFVAQLKAIEGLGEVPEAQLQWLVDHSEILEFEKGEFLFRAGEPAEWLFIIFKGKFRAYLSQKGQNRELALMEPGTITGVLPYSRMKAGIASGVAVHPATVLKFPRTHFQEMIHDHYGLTEALVHVMTTRVRNFTALQQQNEKLMALGKLSAGLAHELNNPAGAVVRSAQELKSHLSYVPERFKAVIKMRVEDEAVDAVNAILYQRIAAEPEKGLSMIEKSEREDELMDWLEDHEIEEGAGEISETLMEYGFQESHLDAVLDAVGEGSLAAVMGWLNNVLTTESLVNEIQNASQQIANLVGSIKSYTHMDREQDKQLVDIHEGIRITATILKHKFKTNQVELIETFCTDRLQVAGFAGELNQVWTNLMDNALDALKGQKGGKIEVETCQLGSTIVVKIIDNGPGIPAEYQSQIFDPFFTTKAMGQGTGMGLDVVHKILMHHRAAVEVNSVAGRTEFSMTFPID